MKYMRITAGYTWTDYKTNTQITKELKITPILDKLLEYKRNWIQHVNRMPRNRLPRVVKQYSANGRRNYGRALKRLQDTWDWNGSTSGLTALQIYDDDDNDDDGQFTAVFPVSCCAVSSLLFLCYLRPVTPFRVWSKSAVLQIRVPVSWKFVTNIKMLTVIQLHVRHDEM